MHMHNDNGRVARKRRNENPVKIKETTPGPSGSAGIKNNCVCFKTEDNYIFEKIQHYHHP